LSEYTHTYICLKISIAALNYYIEYAFDECHQQLTISQLIFALSVVPLIGLRLTQLIQCCSLLQHTVYHWAGLSHKGAEFSWMKDELSGIHFSVIICIYISVQSKLNKKIEHALV